MQMRSWLFAPGDSERKLAKVRTAQGDALADVVIADLEDAVAPERKRAARELTAQWLAKQGAPFARWVRINPLDGDLWREDLEAVMPAAPAGIMVPKAAGPAQLRMLAEQLDGLEQALGIAPGSTRLVPLVSETAASALSIADYALDDNPRLAGLSWGAEDLSAAIGASRKRDEGGAWTDLFRMVRATVLLTAHARGVSAIDTLHADFRDMEGLERVALASSADGFSGMMAIHPAQVEVINRAFTPGETALAEARAIVELFARNPGAGALQLDGRMIDRPHLDLAQKLLAQAGREPEDEPAAG